jgi:hypothetical protein
MNRLIWIIPLLGSLLVGFSLNTSALTPTAVTPTGTTTQQTVKESQVEATPTQSETPVSSKPMMNGSWNLHISWDCFPPAYDLEGEFSEGHIQITDKRGGKFPEGLYMVRSDASDQGNLQINTFNNSNEKTDDYIFSPTMTPIFIYNFGFVGTVNDERTQIKDGKFDITNNKGETTSGCWVAERKDSMTPTMIPTIAPTSKPLPDPSSVLKEFGFTVNSNDFTCSDPTCKEYEKSGTGLVLKVYSNGSMFSLMIMRDPSISIGWVKKVLTKLYPDFADEIVKAIPLKKGASGTAISGQGSDENYKWDASGLWGFLIEVDIVPLRTGNDSKTASTATPTPSVPTENGIPVIKSVNLRKDTSSGALTIYQDILFMDTKGDVTRVDYEIVGSTISGLQVEGGDIDVPEAEQKAGSVITGEWGCGTEKYLATLRATLTDKAGNHSAPFDYEIICDASN